MAKFTEANAKMNSQIVTVLDVVSIRFLFSVIQRKDSGSSIFRYYKGKGGNDVIYKLYSKHLPA